MDINKPSLDDSNIFISPVSEAKPSGKENDTLIDHITADQERIIKEAGDVARATFDSLGLSTSGALSGNPVHQVAKESIHELKQGDESISFDLEETSGEKFQQLVGLFRTQGENRVNKVRTIFKNSRENISTASFETLDHWVEKVKEKINPADREGLQLICHELAATILNEKDKPEVTAMLSEFREELLRVEIAKIRAKQGGDAVSESILWYGIESESDRVDIARLEAINNSVSLADNFDRYTITDEKVRVEIAKLVASKNGYIISFHLDRFEITDETDLIEIARLAVDESPGGVSEFIYKYGIKKESDLIEIAKMAAARDGLAVSRYIQNFKIKDQRALVEIAKIAAAQNGGAVSSYIKDYNIEDESARTEIAMIAAAQRNGNISRYIQNYKIVDQAALVEIAKLAAEHESFSLFKYIENFGIDSPDALKEILSIAALQGGELLSTFIKKYNITDEATIVEMAEIAASNDGDGVARHIKDYNIRDQDSLVEIAKIAASQQGRSVASNIRNFGITDQHQLLEILWIVAQKHENFLWRDFFIEESYIRDAFPYLLFFKDQNFGSEIIENLISKAADTTLREFAETLRLERNPQVRIEGVKILALMLFGCQIEKISLRRMEEGKNLTQGLFKLRNPSIRKILMGDVLNTLKNDVSFQKWQALTAASTSHSRQALPLMLVSSLVSEEYYEPIGKIIKHRDFKEIRRLETLTKCLEKVKSNGLLSVEEKSQVVTRLLFTDGSVSPKKVYQNALMIIQSLSFGKEEELKELATSEEIGLLLENEFKKRYKVSFAEEFSQVYLDFQEKFGRIDELSAYSAAIESLPPYEKTQCLPVLESYIQGIMDGSFQENRYAREKNPHLKEVFSVKGLEQQWRGGVEYPLLDFLGHDEASTTTKLGSRFRSVFLDKIITDNHFPAAELPYVEKVLIGKATMEEALEEVKAAIKMNPEKSKELVVLGMQDKLLKLMQEEITVEDSKAILENVIKVLSRKFPGAELINDLEGELLTIKAKESKVSEQSYEKWKVVDTDDPSTLLVLGSDVAGSCQRVDGNPALNKCLLAYLVDGKNRAMVVTNSNGEMQARSVLRLLWDDESKSPVLIQERVYQHPQCPSGIEDVLSQACVKRAEELNLPLLSETKNEQPYPNRVYSLASSAPFEYVDAGGNGVTTGQWSLDNLWIQPRKSS